MVRTGAIYGQGLSLGVVRKDKGIPSDEGDLLDRID